MTHLLFLIPLSIGMGLVGFAAFMWALRNGQFDDPEGNALRVLAPDTPPDTEGPIHGERSADTRDGDTGTGSSSAREDDLHSHRIDGA